MTKGRFRSRLAIALLPVLVALAWIVPAAGAKALDIYVAPNGSDAAAGTRAHPFATLGRAQEAVRAATASMHADVRVDLRGGVYPLAAPLALSAAAGDSGENGHRVVYRAYGYGTAHQETPVLSGGQAVSGWTLVDPADDVWRANVGALSTRQLYEDGQRLEQASIAAIPGTVTQTATGYTTTSTAPQSWADPADIELTYTTVGYSQASCRVASITGSATETTITMAEPCFEWLTTVYGYNEEEPAEPLPLPEAAPLRNCRSFLEQPGTWAIDRSAPGHHYLYLRANPGEDPNQHELVLPATQTLLSGEGSPGSPLHDVAFKGITFAYSGWEPDPSSGFVGVYGDYYYDGGSPSGSLEEPETRYREVPAAVTFAETEALSFVGDRFEHLGADGLFISGSVDNTLRGNVFTDLAGGGLKLHGPETGDPGNRVEDNWIHDVGVDYQGSIGAYLENMVDSVFQHNQINDVPYSGLVNAGLGTDTLQQTLDEPPGHGMRILDNEIFDVVQVLMDGGGIYSAHKQGTSYEDGALIEGNVVHGAINPAFEEIDPEREVGTPNAMYTDVDSDYITLLRNVLYDSHQTWGGVFPAHLRFDHGFWDDDDLVFYGPTEGIEIGAHNTLLDPARPEAACLEIRACARILSHAGLEPRWRHLLTP